MITPLFTLFLLLAAPAPSSLEQVKSDPNPDHRAKAAVDYASVAEKNAEAAYAKGEMRGVAAELKNVEESHGSGTGRSCRQRENTGPQSRPLQVCGAALARTADTAGRSGAENGHRANGVLIDSVKAKVQEMHDAWFEGIMGRKK